MSALTVTGEEDASMRALADAAAEELALSGNAEVELVYVSEQEIRALNARTRGIDAVTDVLSFPLLALRAGEYPPFTTREFAVDANPESGSVPLGSVVICRDVAARQALEYGHTTERENGYLFVHGLLHLLGYDHLEERDREQMRKEEERILARVGLAHL